MSDDGAVRLATTEDVDQISSSLALAFCDDPVWEYLVPQAKSRSRRLETIFKTMLLHQHLAHSASYTDSERLGAALWDPPGHWRMTPAQLVSGTPGFLRGFGSNVTNAVRTLSTIEKRHPESPPHYYLAALGTRPEHQGKGIGSSLLRPVLARCDEEGVGAYLESSKERNIPFYSRHGFSLTGEIRLPKGPLVWPMWRDPKAPGNS
jgi:ribosomal protein S18 acetylase RimI-like enzyme